MWFARRRHNLTVVIPTLNEEETLGDTLRAVYDGAMDGRPIVYVVDGGSTDNTRRVARRHGAAFRHIVGGRGAQCASVLVRPQERVLFLHGDTVVPRGYDKVIRDTLAEPQVSGGAFKLRIAGTDRRLGAVAWGTNMRSKLFSMPYGDQALFMRGATLRQVGGYPLQSFLDDYELVRRLKRVGRVTLVNNAVVTSARRWRKVGVLRTTLLNQVIVCGYHLGVPVERLRHWYRAAAR